MSSKKCTTTPKKSPKKQADDEVTSLINCTRDLSIKSPYWCAAFTFPYVIYAFNNERRIIHVELFAPNLPEEMIRSIRVRPCGTKLEVLSTTPCWFFESVFMEHRLGDDFHQQHAAVEAHMMHVVRLCTLLPLLQTILFAGRPISFRVQKNVLMGKSSGLGAHGILGECPLLRIKFSSSGLSHAVFL